MVITMYDDDVMLVGQCVKHPDSKLKVIKWREKYFYMDSGHIKSWKKDRYVYFLPDKAHATCITPASKDWIMTFIPTNN